MCQTFDNLDAGLPAPQKPVSRRRGRKVPPVHPGEVLLEEFLKPLEISQYRLATGIRVAPGRINEIVHRTRSVTADTALRLARYFGTSAAFWMNLQARYDLEVQKDNGLRLWAFQREWAGATSIARDRRRATETMG